MNISCDGSSHIISFLHLSDLHFHAPPSQEHVLVFEGLLSDLDKLSRSLSSVLDFIIISGDISFSGKAGEYKAATQYLSRILELTKVPKENVIIVPGNHDVDREKTSNILRPDLQTANEVNALLKNEQDLSFICRKFTHFESFLDIFLGSNNHGFTKNHPFYSRTLNIRGKSIGIGALNSSLLSQEDSEYGKLVLGEYQVRTVIDELISTGHHNLNLAVFHHPLNYLSVFDSEIIQHLLMSYFDIILIGHFHTTDSLHLQSPDSSAQILRAGSEFDNQEWRNSYSLVRFDLMTQEGTVYLRRWNNEAGGRWAGYTGRYDQQDDTGTFSFHLQAKQVTKDTDDIPRLKESLDRQRILHRMRPLLIREQKGLAADIGYVPLKFRFRFGSQETQAHDLEEFLDEWLNNENESTIFILGDFGAGKSRFLQHYTRVLAQHFLRNPDTARVPFPIILGQRKLLGSFDRLLSFTLADNYGMYVSFNEIKELMENGRTVMLLDGFDELAPNMDPHTIQQCINELSGLIFPQNKVIISGRSGYILANPELRSGILGSHDVNQYLSTLQWGCLKQDNSDFRCLYLQDLDDDQVDLFIQEFPHSSDIKKEAVRRFIKVHESVKDLSYRPIILQLLLDCESEVLSRRGITSVSDFYWEVTEAWLTRELTRQGVEADSRIEAADFLLNSVELLACHTFYSGVSDILKADVIKIVQSLVTHHVVEINLENLMEQVSSCIFIEVTELGCLRFKHRSFTEFFVANHILRNIKMGAIPFIGEHLPSIEILDFLRELFDKEAAIQSLHILDECFPPKNLKIVLIIALRQFPELMESRLRAYLSTPNEDFGVKRVAAMSLSEADPEATHELLKLLRTSKHAQFDNVAFLTDLWKADRAEIIRRTRFRLLNINNKTRSYWKHGRGIHVATCAQVGGEEEIEVLEQFLGDPDPIVGECAEEGIALIKSRISPEAHALDRRLELAFHSAKEAGRLLLKQFRKDNPVLHLDPHDLTVQADVEAQREIVKLIRDSFPDDYILAEEEGLDSNDIILGEGDFRWIIDPLDGTVNYAAGLERFSIAIAIENHEALLASVIYSPISGDTYWARSGRGAFLGDFPIAVKEPPNDQKPLVAYSTSCHASNSLSVLGSQLFADITSRYRTMRLFGSVSLDFCDLAAGRFDALIKLPASRWDLCPGQLLVQEANGFIDKVHSPIQNNDYLFIAASCSKIIESLKFTISKTSWAMDQVD